MRDKMKMKMKPIKPNLYLMLLNMWQLYVPDI